MYESGSKARQLLSQALAGFRELSDDLHHGAAMALQSSDRMVQAELWSSVAEQSECPRIVSRTCPGLDEWLRRQLGKEEYAEVLAVGVDTAGRGSPRPAALRRLVVQSQFTRSCRPS
ncbi:hypothetical protein GCM10022235_85550 [Kribbella ginsengisoli]|uniref:Uncharacterized protein n=2 Tax=Kribbella ginsengisoli TaxID=363865 RepID=A0ABP6Z9E7_9ACTN